MRVTTAQSPRAAAAAELVSSLQKRLVAGLERVCEQFGSAADFEPTHWLRDEGRHGGGMRLTCPDNTLLNRASVNVSQVHYDDLPEKRLGSATAISTIIHPHNPHAPSIHLHISWTELKDGQGYWRMMADLNPAIEYEAATRRFEHTLATSAPEQYEVAKAQGERYFFIPALGRHRGAAHFYLEGYRSDDATADSELAQRFGQAVIACYVEILRDAIAGNPKPSVEDVSRQLDYHTLYLFQVLTLDRGTTSGLLVHDQNDLGIMGSLPRFVNRELLASWQSRLASPQDQLLASVVEALSRQQPSPVDDPTKLALAQAVRAHYTANPKALELQASAEVRPPTVHNHR